MKQSIVILIVICCILAIAARQKPNQEPADQWKHVSVQTGKVIGPYSPAQQTGPFLFMSGQICINQETGAMENKDIETEIHKTLENLSGILKAAGYTPDDVVSTTVYLKDMKDFPTMNKIYSDFFHQGNYPARSTIQVAALPKDARIEIAAIAVKSH
ncbi:MAG: RidA family protein [Bacteroidota bacterium]